MNTIYVGWDSREDIAYQVCEHSIYRRTYPQFVTVKPLKQSDLRDRKKRERNHRSRKIFAGRGKMCSR